MRARLTRWIVPLALLGAVLGGGVWYSRQKSKPAGQYQSVPVTRGELTQMVTATGQLNPMVNVQVGSQISGMIQKILVDFNSPVKAGEVIAQLDPATYGANVHQAEGELANAKAALELAQINARRAADLFKNNLISPSEHDKGNADLHQAEAQVKIREATLERAKVDLARCTIYAPVDGVVISRNVDVGQTVAASLQAPTLFQIANDLSQMQIDANVAEADVGGVELGQDVEFTVDAFPYRTFHGKVAQVRNAPIVVQNVVTYDTVIEVSNPDLKLKPGMTANVSIIIAQREDALKIPNAALRFRLPESAATAASTNVMAGQSSPGARLAGGPGGSGWTRTRGRAGGEGRGDRTTRRTVYVLPAGAPEAQPTPVQIKTGISDGLMTEVIEGLNAGDQVLVGMTTPGGSQSPQRPTTNPFGGGMRRF